MSSSTNEAKHGQSYQGSTLSETDITHEYIHYTVDTEVTLKELSSSWIIQLTLYVVTE